MNDEEIKEQFRQKIEALTGKTPPIMPNPQPTPEPVQPNRFAQWFETRTGYLTTMMAFGILLSLVQINSATPYKFIAVRNCLIAYGLYRWHFRNTPKDDIF